MQLTTTFRGLNRSESASATSALEKNSDRLDRLLERPVPMRAVIEGPPEYNVTLSMSIEGDDLVAQSSGHDLGVAINTASDRIRNQLLRMRQRRQSNRQRATPPPTT